MARCGDLDSGIIEFLIKKGWSQKRKLFLNKKSFFGFLANFRCQSIRRPWKKGTKARNWPFSFYQYKIYRSHLVPLDKLDAIVFTGGIGENALPIRSEIIKNLKQLGFVEDAVANQAARFGQSGIIAKSELLGAVAMVIPTNEEYVIAKQSVELL